MSAENPALPTIVILHNGKDCYLTRALSYNLKEMIAVALSLEGYKRNGAQNLWIDADLDAAVQQYIQENVQFSSCSVKDFGTPTKTTSEADPQLHFANLPNEGTILLTTDLIKTSQSIYSTILELEAIVPADSSYRLMLLELAKREAKESKQESTQKPTTIEKPQTDETAPAPDQQSSADYPNSARSAPAYVPRAVAVGIR